MMVTFINFRFSSCLIYRPQNFFTTPYLILSPCVYLMAFFWQYTIAMLGYGPEDKSTVLELTYNYGVTEYDKGNAYAQVSRIFSLPKFFIWNLWRGFIATIIISAFSLFVNALFG